MMKEKLENALEELLDSFTSSSSYFRWVDSDNPNSVRLYTACRRAREVLKESKDLPTEWNGF